MRRAGSLSLLAVSDALSQPQMRLMWSFAPLTLSFFSECHVCEKRKRTPLLSVALTDKLMVPVVGIVEWTESSNSAGKGFFNGALKPKCYQGLFTVIVSLTVFPKSEVCKCFYSLYFYPSIRRPPFIQDWLAVAADSEGYSRDPQQDFPALPSSTTWDL